MSGSEKLKEILTKENLRQIDIANLLETSQQNFNNKVRNDTFKYSELEEIAKLLNYEITWIKTTDIKISNIHNQVNELISKLPHDEQLKIIGRIQEIVEQHEKQGKQQGLSSSSKTG